MNVISCGTSWDILRKVLSSAYFLNTARVKGLGEYVNLFTSVPCHLHPTSALYGLGFTPDYLCYHELVLTSREFMICVTAVDPYWLAELGPMFFAVKEDYKTRLLQKKQHTEQRKVMEEELSKAAQELEDKKRRDEVLFYY
jgi:pre-mRNA-splicing factor ATP-dependent RNA helicase DHX38/PRP16